MKIFRGTELLEASVHKQNIVEWLPRALTNLGNSYQYRTHYYTPKILPKQQKIKIVACVISYAVCENELNFRWSYI